jgi:hypothetical protein
LFRLLTVGDGAAVQPKPTKTDLPKHKRRWFQFSLRTLLVITVLCAIGSARSAEDRRSESATQP